MRVGTITELWRYPVKSLPGDRKRTSRCVLTTRSQPGGLPRDSSVHRDLLRTRDGDLGVYLDPQTAGVLTPGDAVELLP